MHVYICVTVWYMAMYVCCVSRKKTNKHPPLSPRRVSECWRLSRSPRTSPPLLGYLCGHGGCASTKPRKQLQPANPTRQHTPQARKVGDSILLPATIRDRQLLAAGSDPTAKENKQEGTPSPLSSFRSASSLLFPSALRKPDLVATLLSLVFPLSLLDKGRRKKGMHEQKKQVNSEGKARKIV